MWGSFWRRGFILFAAALLVLAALPAAAHEWTLGGSKWCFGEKRMLAAIELGATLFPEIPGVKESGYDTRNLSPGQLREITSEAIAPYVEKRLHLTVNGKAHPVTVERAVLEGSLWRIWVSARDLPLESAENRVRIGYGLLFEETGNEHVNFAHMYLSEAGPEAVQKVFDYTQPVAQHSFESNARIWELVIKGAANDPAAASGQAGLTQSFDSKGTGQGNTPVIAAPENSAAATTAAGKAVEPLSAKSPKTAASGNSAVAPERAGEITPSRQISDATAAGKQHSAGQVDRLVSHSGGGKSIWAGISEFIVLGVKHILVGYDHIAFLVALIVIGLTVREVVKIITAFTIAHSITLLLAAMQIVRLDSRLVEIVIALSICYVALENLFRKEVNYRWLVTFAFGLIHGFGFASALQHLVVGRSNLALTVLSFNIGVEIGQLMIFMALLPILNLLKSRMQFRTVTVGASVAIFVLGLSWLLERAFNLELLSF